MKTHTQIYFNFFGYTEADWIECEIPNCGKQAVDINHIDARGMGGNPKKDKDNIHNLMATCREHHIEFGDKKDRKEQLKKWHQEVINKRLNR